MPTNSPVKFLFLFFAILTSSARPLRALDVDEALLSRTLPIFCGEESFRQRLAQRSPEKAPLGLLLSGGSARAYAHIGVLKRLEEAGIIPDFIVANSMGAIVGMMYAAGMSPDDIERLVSQAPMGELFEPVLPLKGGILDTGKFMDLVYALFGDLDLKDLEIPIIVVCDDLITQRQVWLAEGNFLTVFQAAFSMPVYFDPVPLGAMKLVDGGVSNLIPVNAVAEFTERSIVATTFYDNKRLNFSNPLTILNRDISIGKERIGIDMIKAYDPLVIRCDVEDISFMDYFRIGEIAVKGYRSADKKITEILERVGLNAENPPTTREALGTRLANVLKKLQLGASLPRKPARLSAKAVIEFPASFGTPYKFLKAPFAAFLVSVSTGLAEIRIGPSSPLANPEWNLSLHGFLGSSDNVELSTFHQLSKESIYSQANLQGRYFFPYPLAWFPFVSAEIRNAWDFTILDEYECVGFALKTPEKRSLEAAVKTYGFKRAPDILGIGGEATLAFAPLYPLEIRARGLGRYGFSGSGGFGFFETDGYRGIAPTDSSLPHAICNLELALNADKISVAFAETLLVQRIDTAIFCDIAQSTSTVVAGGISLNIAVSLIGLAPLSASLHGGYDFTAHAPMFAFRMGTLF